jgi:nucleotide-binding universal stress UspA family protein
MRIENILVPVDFSPPSMLAVNYGISLARKFRARLTLLHVVEFPAASTIGFPSRNPTIDQKHREQAVRMLSALVGSEDQDDLDLRIVVKSGEIDNEIPTAISEHKADIVVMGTHGRGLIGRCFVGSVTQNLLRKISVPILTVSRVSRPLEFKRVLYATDLCTSSREFGLVLELARNMNVTVVLLHCVEPVTVASGVGDMPPYVGGFDREEAGAKLAELVAEGNRHDVRVETVVVEGRPAAEILKAADSNDIDLVLLNIRPKGIIERAFLGTTAEQVIRESHVPVLSVPYNVAGSEQEN